MQQHKTPYGSVDVPGTVLGMQTRVGRVDTPTKQPNKPHRPPEADLPRSLNYYADYSGCGHWRMIWPEQLLNAYQKSIIHGSSVMVMDERHYRGVNSVRIQRQATEAQLNFMKFLRDICNKQSINLLYEIDDICLREDIPDYNKFKFAFDNDKVRQAIIDMMLMTDEMTVTCKFMKDYYMDKTGHKQVTVIPNFIPKFWMDRFYNPKKIELDFQKNLRKPRVLYAGSGAHFDVANKTGQQDDFTHVLKFIAATVNDFQWVFIGGYPPLLQNYVKSGKIEFHNWSHLYDYPQKLYDLNVNCMVAPLQDNNFNRAKSNLKFLEACAYGLPCICQDMCTYEDAMYKFKTGEEMIDQIKDVIRDRSRFMNISKKCRSRADGMWLEDNIECYRELYNTKYGDPKRVTLAKWNN